MSSTTITDPSKVQVSGEGLHFGYINHNIEALIDTRGAGPGKIPPHLIWHSNLKVYSWRNINGNKY